MMACTKLAVPILVVSAIIALLPAPPAAELPPLIPRDVLFGNPQKTSPRISPDGTALAYLAPSDRGVMNIWVRSIDRDDAVMVTNVTRGGIPSFMMRWAYDNRHILFLKDNDGDEIHHVFMVDTKSKILRDLTPFSGFRSNQYALAKSRPDEILVALNLRDPRTFEIFRIDLNTGALKFDTQIPGNFIDWAVDENLTLRAAMVVDPKDGSTILRVRDGQDKPWRDLLTFPFGEKGRFLGFLPSGRSAYIESSLGSDTSRLIEIDLQTGRTLRVISFHDQCDIGSVLISPATGLVQAVSYEHLQPERKLFDEELRKDFEILGRTRSGVFEVINRDAADRKWIVIYFTDAASNAACLYDRDTGTVDLLFEDRPELSKYTLAKMKPELISARDGLKLVSYLTLPVGLEPRKLPLVLLVHGGPWARDTWGYTRVTQLLANRGYAVLQVNFRGSDGFGKKFLNAGNGQWGVGGMQHDLTDAVAWAVGKGIADPRRIAIVGISYGGYAALAGLAFTPELYACGVDMFGPADINTMMDSLRGPRRKVFLQRIGDVEADPELNRKISPFYHVDKIRAPLLVGQGQNDPRVRIEQSDRMVRALQEAKRPVKYVVYSDEGHTFQRPENNLDFWGHVEEFLAEHLGGRAEPYRKIPGSSGEIRTTWESK
jgi:dipeptidyl aminopeptidase/acylaminoacyl peptidase